MRIEITKKNTTHTLHNTYYKNILMKKKMNLPRYLKVKDETLKNILNKSVFD